MPEQADLLELRDHLAELAPLWRRAARIEPAAPTRVQAGERRVVGLVRPFGALAGRPILLPVDLHLDATFRATELADWAEGVTDVPPPRREADWHWSLPPTTGWRRVDDVPGDVVRDLVRSGALTLKDAADREGVPDAQPRAQVTESLLDSIVITVSDEPRPDLPIQLRALTTLTRMGFLAQGGAARIDALGRWARIVGQYGSVYLEARSSGLGLIR